ncbi:hypothetical protein M5E87_03730 [Flavonifractor plautii]|nr:hypothetical protein M5E87_03730 [Flavonifractor plautii]
MIGEQLARLTRPGPAELDVSQCPDLVPPLAAMAALRAGRRPPSSTPPACVSRRATGWPL